MDRLLMETLKRALESAPHKTRIDFQAYWDWFDGPRQDALDALTAGATESEPARKK